MELLSRHLDRPSIGEYTIECIIVIDVYRGIKELSHMAVEKITHITSRGGNGSREQTKVDNKH